MASAVTITGLQPLIKELRGPMLRDVNRELRAHAKQIAATLVPVVAASVARSGAPQASAVAATVRVHSDRVPVVVIGKTNPRLSGFNRRGPRRDGAARANPRQRRGAIAHGVVYGPAGGRADTGVNENYYRIGRDNTGGPVGRAVNENGAVFDEACRAYLDAYTAVLRRHGFTGQSAQAMRWGG